MIKRLGLQYMMKRIAERFCKLSDNRSKKNSKYEMKDAGMGAFSTFFTQCPSFLAHQEEMKRIKGLSNTESLFEIEKIPSDNQIRSMLDPVSPEEIMPQFREIFIEMKESGILESYRSIGKTLLIAMDGTEYYSSKKIHCEKCSHRTLKNGEINYFHGVLMPVIVQAGNEHVISLEPEFIVPQDGDEKQDCEIKAAKRWLEKYGDFYAKQGVTFLGDDLFSRQPFCQAVKDKKLHFILVCKPDSHEMLYKTVDFLSANGVLPTKQVRKWNGRYAEIYTYRYTNKLPLCGDENAMEVNWCEIVITREDTGELIYHNAFVTDFRVNDTNVEAIVRDGRAQWKVENENNNVLKTKGYHLEHNFGHGAQYLSSFLLTLNLLAFLFHTIQDLVDVRYQMIRQALRKRQRFFQHMETLLFYFPFQNWDNLFDFMFNGLQLKMPAPS